MVSTRAQLTVAIVLLLALAGSVQGQQCSGQALAFDGVDDRVTIPDDSSLDIAGSFTLETWVYRNESGEYAEETILDKDDEGGADTNYYFAIDPEIDELPARLAFKAFGCDLRSNGDVPLTTGSWHHVAVTYDGQYFRFYVDGQEDGVIECSPDWQLNDGPLSIGLNATSNAGPFAGIIDEVRIWKTARTQAALEAKMTCLLNGDEPGLVAYYQFQDCQGDAVCDASVEGNHGVLGDDDPPNDQPQRVASDAPLARCFCPADIDGDGDIDTADLLTLLAAWGPCE